MIRSKGEAGTGDVSNATTHMRTIRGEIRRLTSLSEDELYVAAKELQAPVRPGQRGRRGRQAARRAVHRRRHRHPGRRRDDDAARRRGRVRRLGHLQVRQPGPAGRGDRQGHHVLRRPGRDRQGVPRPRRGDGRHQRRGDPGSRTGWPSAAGERRAAGPWSAPVRATRGDRVLHRHRTTRWRRWLSPGCERRPSPVRRRAAARVAPGGTSWRSPSDAARATLAACRCRRSPDSTARRARRLPRCRSVPRCGLVARRSSGCGAARLVRRDPDDRRARAAGRRARAPGRPRADRCDGRSVRRPRSSTTRRPRAARRRVDDDGQAGPGVRLLEPLRAALRAGLPAYGSCAGMILLADRIAGRAAGPGDARRARHRRCGATPSAGRSTPSRRTSTFDGLDRPARCTRCSSGPRGSRTVGAGVAGARAGRRTGRPPVGSSRSAQGTLLATSFHPELTGDARVHELFVRIVKDVRREGAAMSGHSKWATTKHKKAVVDARRGKIVRQADQEHRGRGAHRRR